MLTETDALRTLNHLFNWYLTFIVDLRMRLFLIKEICPTLSIAKSKNIIHTLFAAIYSECAEEKERNDYRCLTWHSSAPRIKTTRSLQVHHPFIIAIVLCLAYNTYISCPRGRDPFYIVTYYMKRVTTSRAYSIWV